MIGQLRKNFGLAMLFAVTAAAPAFAADVVTPTTPLVDGWKYQASLYGWATALNGDVGIRGLPPAHVNLSAWDAIEHLDGAFAGQLMANDGTWLLFADFMYAKVKADYDFKRSSGSGNFDQEQILFTALVGRRIPLNVENLQLFGTVGLRYQHYKANLDIDPERFRSISRSGSKDWVDPVIGLSMHYDFTPKWFLEAMADIGGFGVGSHFTTQDTVAVGYNWNDRISSSLGYRVLYTDYSKNGFVYDTTQHGIILSATVHF
jgi:opacity protein-like surface antigen